MMISKSFSHAWGAPTLLCEDEAVKYSAMHRKLALELVDTQIASIKNAKNAPEKTVILPLDEIMRVMLSFKLSILKGENSLFIKEFKTFTAFVKKNMSSKMEVVACGGACVSSYDEPVLRKMIQRELKYQLLCASMLHKHYGDIWKIRSEISKLHQEEKTTKPSHWERFAAKLVRRKEVEANMAEALQKRKRREALKMWRRAIRQVVLDVKVAKPVVAHAPKGKKVASVDDKETRVYVTRTSQKKKSKKATIHDPVEVAKREMEKEVSLASVAKNKEALARRRAEEESEAEARAEARRVAREIGGW